MISEPTTRAKRQTFSFVMISFFINFLMLLGLRANETQLTSFFLVPDITWMVFFSAAFVAAILLVFYFVCIQICFDFKVKTIVVPEIFLYLLLSSGFIINIFCFIFLDAGSRYSGGLRGMWGVVYFVNSLITFLGSLAILLHRNSMRASVVVFWSIGIAIGADGLSRLLFLGAFIFLFLRLRGLRFSALRLAGIGVLAIGLGAYGLSIKTSEAFSANSNYLLEVFPLWLQYRFSVNAVTIAQIFSNESYFSWVNSGWLQYLELIFKANWDRLSLIFFDYYEPIYPRTVSEAVARDFTGVYGSGSSPGIFAGSIIGFPVSLLVYPVALVPVVVFFQRVNFEFRILDFLFIIYFFKQLVADISEYLILISPSLLVLVGAIVVVITRFRALGAP